MQCIFITFYFLDTILLLIIVLTFLWLFPAVSYFCSQCSPSKLLYTPLFIWFPIKLYLYTWFYLIKWRIEFYSFIMKRNMNEEFIISPFKVQYRCEIHSTFTTKNTKATSPYNLMCFCSNHMDEWSLKTKIFVEVKYLSKICSFLPSKLL